jgi:hypothetical protein
MSEFLSLSLNQLANFLGKKLERDASELPSCNLKIEPYPDNLAVFYESSSFSKILKRFSSSGTDNFFFVSAYCGHVCFSCLFWCS